MAYDRCVRCGRPRYVSGSGVEPDYETLCAREGVQSCRIAAVGRSIGLREAIEVAKRNSPVRMSDGSVFRGVVDWSEADAEIARMTGGKDE